MDSFEDQEHPPVSELSRRQRRVLGVLVEKAFTTPEYYPLTLKAATNGCNQKSNRAPVSSYNEDDVEEALDELREMGLVTVIHTDGGRAPRYRHWMRKRFSLSEPQLAILTELLLRGRQSLGELRSRSSRMVSIDSLDQLREELAGLQGLNLLQASGSLERRGVEVDHNLYAAKEGMSLPTASADVADEPSSPRAAGTPSPAPAAASDGRVDALEAVIGELRTQNQEFAVEISSLREELQRLEDNMERLRSELGG
ncbi:hypothetical protein CA54_04400 [Symmachiella macrocystis]|uniref:DUF480 domain-containing protein n=1 Tax=Symmachiella macrocystis TaxID=2527985 RepID=A0A5C6BIU5_9PLAN|nr:DUF480 domain-containing protein [Symmachiella macrocystis]TWU11632.1 hypothetical protein CA54_04400 [Symmachiella macrocystis]